MSGEPLPFQRRLLQLLEPAEGGDVASWCVDLVLQILILADIVCLTLHSWQVARGERAELLAGYEAFIVTAFTVEYFLRLWAAGADPRYRPPEGNRFAYARTPLALVDLFAILPAVALIPGWGLLSGWLPPWLTSLRIFRVIRIAKLARYSHSVRSLLGALWSIRSELVVLLLCCTVVITVSSALIYRFEHESQPETFGSMADAMWWAVVTMATVGYGDLTPVTAPGRVVATVLMVSGIGLFTLPAGLLGAAFVEEMARLRELRRRRREARARRAREREEASRHEVQCPRCDHRFVAEAKGPRK